MIMIIFHIFHSGDAIILRRSPFSKSASVSALAITSPSLNNNSVGTPLTLSTG